LENGIIYEARISDENKGTLLGVSEGIDWFFRKVDVGIIIEDDLIIHPPLLRAVEFSAKSLQDPRVLSIGLHNHVPKNRLSEPQSLIRGSKFVVSWGWVTTKDKWNNRVLSFADVHFWKLFKIMFELLGLSSALYHLYFYRRNLYFETHNVLKCNWDDLWQINCFLGRHTVIALNRNLISNIGDGFGATHTFGKDLKYSIDEISIKDINDLDAYKNLPEIDISADEYFVSNRKIFTIARGAIAIRTRIHTIRRRFLK